MSAAGKTGGETSSGATQTIMVVDPNPTFLKMATRMLERRGYRVLSVDDGQKALRLLSDSKVRVDALLVELDLSESLTGTGLAALAVKQRRGLPQYPRRTRFHLSRPRWSAFPPCVPRCNEGPPSNDEYVTER